MALTTNIGYAKGGGGGHSFGGGGGHSFGGGYRNSGSSSRSVSNSSYSRTVQFRARTATQAINYRTVTVGGRTFKYNSAHPPILYSRNNRAYLYQGPRVVPPPPPFYGRPYASYGYRGYYGYGSPPTGFSFGSDFLFWMFYFNAMNHMNQQQVMVATQQPNIAPIPVASPSSYNALHPCNYYDANGGVIIVNTPDPCQTAAPTSDPEPTPDNVDDGQ